MRNKGKDSCEMRKGIDYHWRHGHRGILKGYLRTVHEPPAGAAAVSSAAESPDSTGLKYSLVVGYSGYSRGTQGVLSGTQGVLKVYNGVLKGYSRGTQGIQWGTQGVPTVLTGGRVNAAVDAVRRPRNAHGDLVARVYLVPVQMWAG